MSKLTIAVVMLGFYSMICFAVWYTHTAWALFALMLTPSLEFNTKEDKSD